MTRNEVMITKMRNDYKRLVKIRIGKIDSEEFLQSYLKRLLEIGGYNP